MAGDSARRWNKEHKTPRHHCKFGETVQSMIPHQASSPARTNCQSLTAFPEVSLGPEQYGDRLSRTRITDADRSVTTNNAGLNSNVNVQTRTNNNRDTDNGRHNTDSTTSASTTATTTSASRSQRNRLNEAQALIYQWQQQPVSRSRRQPLPLPLRQADEITQANKPKQHLSSNKLYKDLTLKNHQRQG